MRFSALSRNFPRLPQPPSFSSGLVSLFVCSMPLGNRTIRRKATCGTSRGSVVRLVRRRCRHTSVFYACKAPSCIQGWWTRIASMETRRLTPRVSPKRNKSAACTAGLAWPSRGCFVPGALEKAKKQRAWAAWAALVTCQLPVKVRGCLPSCQRDVRDVRPMMMILEGSRLSSPHVCA